MKNENKQILNGHRRQNCLEIETEKTGIISDSYEE